LTPLYIFMIRVVMGIVFAILATRLFYPDSGMVTVMAVATVLVGMAYILENFRKRNK